MKTLQIPIKFKSGDIIYTTKQVRVETNCHICEGTGKINYNGKDMRCPECNGNGKFVSNKQTNVVIEEPFIISTTKISINGNGEVSINYKGHCGFNNYNRAEDNLFFMKEEAQDRCTELNKEKKFINITDIVIQEDFKETQPSIDKIQSKLDYYKKHNKFDKNIVINKDNVLIDGYINYLIGGLLNLGIVKVIVEEII